jgi:hypothetical protein
MKLHFPPEHSMREAASRLVGLPLRRASLERARAQLGHAVGDALSSSLELLGERLRMTRLASDAGRTGQRLRDVVERDRALGAVVAKAPKQAPTPEPAPELPPSERAQASVPNEPIRTRTMARLLAAQGYRARALAIYEELIQRNPSDRELADEAAPLRA